MLFPSRTKRTLFPRPALRVEPLETRAVPATLLVSNVAGNHAAYHSIQSAVDAAHSGDTVLVAPGVYQEQVDVTTNGLTLRSQTQYGAVIQAPAVLSPSNDLVHIDGATGVSLTGFTVSGPGGSPGNLDIGVLVDDGGSATIRNNYVTTVRDNPLSGVQAGVAVVVGGASPGTADVTGNTINEYQKGGVVVAHSGSDATVSNNTIVGAGPTGTIGQNGVQVSDGATARVTGNTITGNQYTGPSDVFVGGVFVTGAGATTVSGNVLTGNEIGVFAVGPTTALLVTGNTVTGSTVSGIDLSGVAGAVVSGNQVSGGGEYGILLEGGTTTTVVQGNTVTGTAGYGIAAQDAGTSGNTINRNTSRNNATDDLFDNTTGTGTAGTANFYSFNKFGTASPGGLK